MVKKIGIGLLMALTLLVIFIATRPAHFRIQRSALIQAPSAVVFPLIDDFHNWPKWSPWEKLDPSMKKSFSGPPAGAGASYAWVGNDKAGEGRMTITDSKPTELVTMKLEFIKPFAATNQAVFALTPSGTGTQVVWSMEGDNGFVAKAFAVFVNVDKMVGKDFEDGLAKLNTVAQSPAP